MAKTATVVIETKDVDAPLGSTPSLYRVTFSPQGSGQAVSQDTPYDSTANGAATVQLSLSAGLYQLTISLLDSAGNSLGNYTKPDLVTVTEATTVSIRVPSSAVVSVA